MEIRKSKALLVGLLLFLGVVAISSLYLILGIGRSLKEVSDNYERQLQIPETTESTKAQNDPIELFEEIQDFYQKLEL